MRSTFNLALNVKQDLLELPKSLKRGKSKVEVSYEEKEIRVTFDDEKTDTKALVKATTDAGFPSKAESQQK